MKVLGLALVVSTATLVGCSTTGNSQLGRSDILITTENVKLRVVPTDDGFLTVDQEPVHTKKNAHDFNITWQLPDGYEFTEDGIMVADVDKQFYKCARDNDTKKFSCFDHNDKAGGGVYKYLIKVKTTGGLMLTPLDPTIRNQG